MSDKDGASAGACEGSHRRPADAHGGDPTGTRGGSAPGGVSGGEPRSWTVELPAGIQLLNANDRLHHRKRAARVKVIRFLARYAARRAGVPALERAQIVAEFRPPDRRRRDVHNLYPSAKAAVDGLVDAQVLPDDSDEYLTGPDMRIGAPVRGGQLVLHITEEVR